MNSSVPSWGVHHFESMNAVVQTAEDDAELSILMGVIGHHGTDPGGGLMASKFLQQQGGSKS